MGRKNSLGNTKKRIRDIWNLVERCIVHIIRDPGERRKRMEQKNYLKKTDGEK